MTKGKINFCVDQVLSENIYVTYGIVTDQVVLRQGEQRILLKPENIDKMIDALKSMKQWSNSK